MMRYLLVFSLISLPFEIVTAQEIDTVQVLRILQLEGQLDSLRRRLTRMDSTLERMKYEQLEGTDISRFLASIDEEVDAVPEDQRSRRRRIDAMLKAIVDRPGQLRFNGDATAILQGNISNTQRMTTATGSFDIFAHTTLGNTLLFFNFEAIGGNGPNEHFATFSSLNADAGSTQSAEGIDHLTVLEAWGEFTAFDEAVTLTAGKIDLSNYFDNNAAANDETAQFISGSFVNSAALPFPGSGPGIRIRTTILHKFFVQAGLGKIQNSGDRIFDQLFKIASIGLKILPETDWQGNLRMYFYLHPGTNGGGGGGVSFDQYVTKKITAFARWNRNAAGVAQLMGIRSAWSGGLRFATTIDGRRLVVAAAYGQTSPFDGSLKSERTMELYVRHQLNKWIFLSPHLQIVHNMAGASRALTLLGIRSQFNF